MSDEIGSAPWAVFGDWHGHLGMGLAAIRSASDQGVSTLIHVGDFGLDWPGAERGRYEKKLNTLLLERGAVLVVSPGNHDNLSAINLLDVQEDGLIAWRSNIKVLPKGGRTIIGGLRVGGLGGAFSTDRSRRREGKDLWMDEEEPTVEQAEQLIAGGDLVRLRPVTDLRSLDDKEGVYVLVLDEYRQAYIGQSWDMRKRIKKHWNGTKQFDRLLWGGAEESVMSIDSFRALDTTRIFAARTISYDSLETRLVRSFPPDYLLNRIGGGAVTGLRAVFISAEMKRRHLVTEPGLPGS